MKSLYIIYKIINKVNNKFYIGIHKTKDINDDYFGSGHSIKAAIKKYGKENFTKQILHVYTNKIEAYKKERELVTEDLVKNINCYNLAIGGHGNFDYIRDKGLHRSTLGRKVMYDPNTNQIKKVKADLIQEYLQQGWLMGYSPLSKERMSLGGKRKIQAPEHRKKNSEAKKNSKVLYDPKTNKHKFVHISEIDSYLQNGWVYNDYGAGMHRVMYNPITNEQKRVLKTEVSIWTSQGWLLGFSPKTRKNMLRK